MRPCTPDFTNAVNRRVRCRPVMGKGRMLMSALCRARSQRSGENGLVFLASPRSRVTSVLRDLVLLAKPPLSFRHHPNAWLTRANVESVHSVAFSFWEPIPQTSAQKKNGNSNLQNVIQHLESFGDALFWSNRRVKQPFQEPGQEAEVLLSQAQSLWKHSECRPRSL